MRLSRQQRRDGGTAANVTDVAGFAWRPIHIWSLLFQARRAGRTRLLLSACERLKPGS